MPHEKKLCVAIGHWKGRLLMVAGDKANDGWRLTCDPQRNRCPEKPVSRRQAADTAPLCVSSEGVMWAKEFSLVNILKHTDVSSFNNFYEGEEKRNKFNSVWMWGWSEWVYQTRSFWTPPPQPTSLCCGLKYLPIDFTDWHLKCELWVWRDNLMVECLPRMHKTTEHLYP